MGKMTGALLLCFAIELSLSIFLISTPTGTHSALYNFLINPDFYGSDAWFGDILSKITSIATLGVIVVGLFAFIKLEPIYAAMTIAIYSFILNIIRLWSTVNSQITLGPMSGYIATVVCAPLLIFYIMACLDYIRSPNG